MIKTLRITTVIVVVLAGVLFVIPVVFGAREDERVEKLLNGPSIIEQFNNTAGGNAKPSQRRISPLVEQAQAFALFLNPPVTQNRPPSRPVARRQQDIPRPETAVSAKFTLVATSVNESNPEQSFALINEPGKGIHWVRQSETVGHLDFELIKDGVVVVKDKQSTFEISTEERPTMSTLLEGAPQVGARSPAQASSIPTSVAAQRPTTSHVGTRPPFRPPTRPPQPQIGPEESAKLEELVDKLKALQEQRGPGQGPGDDADDVLMEAMKKLMSGEQPNTTRQPNSPGAAGKDPAVGKGPYKPPQRTSGSSGVDPRAQRSNRSVRKLPQLPSRYQDPRRGR